MIYHNFNSLVVIEVKSKEHLYPIMMKLKESVFNKSKETLSQKVMG